jgi:hypothetical protein
MEIHALKVSITEQDLKALLTEMPSGKHAIQNLRVRLTPEGVVVQGEYPTMLMRMSFETLWQVHGIGSEVVARLTSIKVSGLPASMLRGVLLKTLRDTLAKNPGVRVEDESIHIDLCKVAAAREVHLSMNLTAVRCGEGNLLIEGGALLV